MSASVLVFFDTIIICRSEKRNTKYLVKTQKKGGETPPQSEDKLGRTAMTKGFIKRA